MRLDEISRHVKSDVKNSQDMSCKGVGSVRKVVFLKIFWYRVFMCFKNDLGVIYLYLTTIPGSLFQKKNVTQPRVPSHHHFFKVFFGKSQVISVLPMGFEPRTSPKTPEPSIYVYFFIKIYTVDCAGGVLPNSTYQLTNLCVFYNKVSTRWFGGFCPSAVFLPSLSQFDPVGSTVFGRFLIHLPYQGLLRRTCLSRRGLTGLVDKLECRSWLQFCSDIWPLFANQSLWKLC